MMAVYPVPKTVEEAAKYLDEIKPGWEKLIDLDRLNMASLSNCILGQLFSHEEKYSFNKKQQELFGCYCIGVFGNFPLQWKDEINKRGMKMMSGTWTWACQQLLEGKKIYRKVFKGTLVKYWQIQNNSLYYFETDRNSPVILPLVALTATDWEVYNPILLSSVKIGQKIKFKESWAGINTTDVYMKTTSSYEGGKSVLRTVVNMNSGHLINWYYESADPEVELC